MLATNEYNKEDVIKSMPTINEYQVSHLMVEKLSLRYKKWKKIVEANESIANTLMEK